MVKQEFVKRLEALEKRVDFVPTVIDKVLAKGVVAFVSVLPAAEKYENH